MTSSPPDQQSLETKLRAAEEKAICLFRSSRDGILCIDGENGIILEANPALGALLGCSIDQVCGKKLWELCPATYSEAQRTLFKQMQTSALTSLPALAFQRADGNLLLLPFIFESYGTAEQKIILCTIQSSHTSNVELAHSEIQESFRQLLETSPNVAYRRNLATNYYEYVSPSIFQMTGYTAEEIMQLSPLDISKLLHPDDLERIRSSIQTGMNQEPTPHDVEYRLRHKDGRFLWLSDVFTITRDDHGNPNFIYGNLRDISAQKMEREELHKTAEHYRTLTETMKDVVWIMDAETLYFRYVSPSVVRLRGYTPQEILALPMDYALLSTETEHLKNLIRERCEYLSNNPNAPSKFYTEQVEQPCKDGSTVLTEVITTYTRNPENGRIEIIGVTRDITDRKQAEDILRDSEDRYHSLFDNMQEGVALHRVIYDEKGRAIDYILEDLNPAYERQVGIDASQVKGKLASVAYGVSPAPYLEIFSGVAETGKAYFFETYFPPLDRHFEISVISTRKGRFATIFLDVSARKRAEEALFLKDQLLHMTGAMAKVGGWEFDVQTHQYSWTDETARIFGLDPLTPMTEATILNFYNDPSRQSLIQARTEALEIAEPYDLELGLNATTGQQKIVRVVGNPEIQNGVVVKVRGIIQDITEQAEARLARRESERRFQQLFKLAPIPLCSIENNGASIHINDKFKATFGYSLSDFSTIDEWWQIAYPDAEYRQHVLARWHAAIQKAHLEDGEIEPDEFSITCKDATQRTVIISGAVIKDGFLVSFFDITELKQVTQTLELQRSELARSNAELEQFAYVTSHDLQEPLRMISSYVQLLARRYKGRLDSDADEFINYAVEGTARMQRLINDLLSYSRVGTRGRAFVTVACEKILEQVLANLRLSIQENNATITHDPLPILKADELQMGQLFQNLISNALKFHGTEPLHIHISVESRGHEWVFGVKDNGIGIDPQYSERIFIIFQRLHTRTEYPGTGIGLAICKKIVERHGGKIWLESELQKGSTFYFSIPS